MEVNLGRPSNFNELTADEWIRITELVMKNFKHRLTIDELREAIEWGVTARYDKKQYQVNSTTIFRFIRQWLENENDR